MTEEALCRTGSPDTAHYQILVSVELQGKGGEGSILLWAGFKCFREYLKQRRKVSSVAER